MEKLIAFFVQNPFILIIIVGLLYSMFFRKSPLEKRPPGNRPGGRPGTGSNRMPNFGGSPVFAPKPQQTDAGAPARRPEIGPSYGGLGDPAPQPADGPFPPVEIPRSPSYSLQEQERTEPVRPEQPRVVPARTPAAAASYAAVAPTDGRAALSADDLRRAVVWAEIIGPPRAKRPYYRR